MRSALRARANCLTIPTCAHPYRALAARPLLAHNTPTRLRSDDTESTSQAFPFKGYYEDMLDAPLHQVASHTRTSPAPPPPDELPKTEAEERLAKARVVFGSRLAGPHERREQIERASHNVAGILVPPRPEEPDNCCMSGCVNCVWDRYRDEMEEWAAKSAEARAKVQEQRTRGSATGLMAGERGMPTHVAISMDDDGGGSETSWAGMESFGQGKAASTGSGGGGAQESADLFADIPVGIREFMKTEKRLKEEKVRRREASAAG